MEELKALPIAHEVEVDLDLRRHFDNFLYPILNVDEDRAVIMGLNALTKLEQILYEKIGSGGSAFLFQMGRGYAIENFKILTTSSFAQDQESQLRNLCDFLKSSGWGIFEIRKLWNGFDVMVTEPYLLDGHTFVDNRFIYGLLAGSLQAIFGEELYVLESKYDTRANTILVNLRSRRKDENSRDHNLAEN